MRDTFSAHRPSLIRSGKMRLILIPATQRIQTIQEAPPMSRRLVYFNGDFVSEQEARISIFDCALRYGDLLVWKP